MLDELAMSAASVMATVSASDAVVAPAVPRIRERSPGKSRDRYCSGNRQVRALVGKRKDRMAFLEHLARHGDPAVAADQLGLPLFVLFRHRDADPAFAAEWLAAVNYAWERVESRVLAALLANCEVGNPPEAGASQKAPKSLGTGVGQIDIRLALAIVNRREKPVLHRGSARPTDGTAAARLRAELRALAGLADGQR